MPDKVKNIGYYDQITDVHRKGTLIHLYAKFSVCITNGSSSSDINQKKNCELILTKLLCGCTYKYV